MSQGNPTQHEIDVYCAEWILNGGDQSKAWRKAYPTSTMTESNVHTKACNMHKMVKVQSRLSELQSITAEKDALEFDMSVSEIKAILREVIELGLARKSPASGDEPTINLSAVNTSLQELNRMNGNHAAQKINASVVTMTHEEWLANLDD